MVVALLLEEEGEIWVDDLIEEREADDSLAPPTRSDRVGLSNLLIL